MTGITRRRFLKGVAATGAIGFLNPTGLTEAAPVELPPSLPVYSGMFNDIVDICASYHGTTRDAVLAPGRERREVRARQSAMYIARRLTTRSLPEIGRRIGCRDHTTVLHADRKISGLIESDPMVRHSIEVLTDACRRMAQTRLAAGAPTGWHVG